MRLLGPRFNAKSYGEVVKAFEAEVAAKIAANGGALGSNKAAGTAINFARSSYSAVRTRFGQLLAEKGINLTGTQVHHALEELAKNPLQAIQTTNLMFAKGNAGTIGSGHNFAHAVNDAKAAGAKNPGQQVVADLKAQGIKPDVPELSPTIRKPTPTQAAATEVETAVKTEVKEGAEVLAKETGHVVEESALKQGAKFLGKKVAKFTPILGVGVAIVLTGKDAHAGEYEAAAWDAAEGVPVAGDAVGILHLAVLGAQAVPELFAKMFEGQRAKDVARFEQQNPDASPQAFDQMQRVQEAFDNGNF